MRKAQIQTGGVIQLGDEAIRAGYQTGAVVQIVVMSTGSLLVVIDDEVPLEVPFRPLMGGAAQLAMRRGRETDR